MGKHTTPGRILSSALLLSVIVLQWITGTVYFRQTALVDITPEMTADEQTLAEAIEEEFGFSPRVRIHDIADLTYLNTLGYGAPFLLTESVHQRMTAFTLVESGPDLLVREDLIGGQLHDTSDEEAERMCVERLFSPVLFIPVEQISPVCTSEGETHFPIRTLQGVYDPEILAPPPRYS